MSKSTTYVHFVQCPKLGHEQSSGKRTMVYLSSFEYQVLY